MNKIKNIWNNNRVLVVLALIVITCFCIMGIVMVKYFFGGNTSSYGDRLQDINGFAIEEDTKEKIIASIKENEKVEEVSFKVKGKIIYIRIQFNSKTSLEEAKQIANKSLEIIPKEYQEKFDLEYTINQLTTNETAGYTLMGAKNINRTKLIWNNNTPVKND